MKTWLKGGLIGLLIGFFMLIITYIIHPMVYYRLSSKILLWPLTILGYFGAFGVRLCYLITQCVGESCMGCGLIFGPPVTLLLFFIIGAIIGLIIQKVTKK